MPRFKVKCWKLTKISIWKVEEDVCHFPFCARSGGKVYRTNVNFPTYSSHIPRNVNNKNNNGGSKREITKKSCSFLFWQNWYNFRCTWVISCFAIYSKQMQKKRKTDVKNSNKKCFHLKVNHLGLFFFYFYLFIYFFFALSALYE